MVVSAGGCWGCAPLAGLGGSVGGDALEVRDDAGLESDVFFLCFLSLQVK